MNGLGFSILYEEFEGARSQLLSFSIFLSKLASLICKIVWFFNSSRF